MQHQQDERHDTDDKFTTYGFSKWFNNIHKKTD